jgi:hypothetical protein
MQLMIALRRGAIAQNLGREDLGVNQSSIIVIDINRLECKFGE